LEDGKIVTYDKKAQKIFIGSLLRLARNEWKQTCKRQNTAVCPKSKSDKAMKEAWIRAYVLGIEHMIMHEGEIAKLYTEANKSAEAADKSRNQPTVK